MTKGPGFSTGKSTANTDIIRKVGKSEGNKLKHTSNHAAAPSSKYTDNVHTMKNRRGQ